MTKEINNRIQQLIRQRNELRAQVERLRLRECFQVALNYRPDEVNEETVHDLLDTPAQCPAEHDAALLERLAEKVRHSQPRAYAYSSWAWAAYLSDEAKRIRGAAK